MLSSHADWSRLVNEELSKKEIIGILKKCRVITRTYRRHIHVSVAMTPNMTFVDYEEPKRFEIGFEPKQRECMEVYVNS
jgi:hypothetical protein